MKQAVLHPKDGETFEIEITPLPTGGFRVNCRAHINNKATSNEEPVGREFDTFEEARDWGYEQAAARGFNGSAITLTINPPANGWR
jgi:hypothetical protein